MIPNVPRQLAQFLVISVVLLAARPAVASAARTAEVIRAEQSRVDALFANDVAALEKILADDLTYTHSTGALDTKVAYLASLRSSRLRYRSLEHTDPHVRFYGETAVMNTVAKVVSVADGAEHRATLRVTLVYLWRASRWQMVAWHSTRIP